MKIVGSESISVGMLVGLKSIRIIWIQMQNDKFGSISGSEIYIFRISGFGQNKKTHGNVNHSMYTVKKTKTKKKS